MKLTRSNLIGQGKQVWLVQIQQHIGGEEWSEDIERDFWLADDWDHLMEQLAEGNDYYLSGEFSRWDWIPKLKAKIKYGEEGRTGKDFEKSIDEHWGKCEIDCLGPFKEAKTYEVRLVEIESEDDDDEDYDDEDED